MIELQATNEITMLDSKQIMFVVYDLDSSQMIVHYHSGEMHIYSFIPKEEYQAFIESVNQYDFLVKITEGRDHTRLHTH